ncbi:MinD/ParA family ATP-binding protein [Jongsikchunia kroppenstedtii]|uniref:MinD/ParA family ATP-binding protein n=1 Tax=Jongsikchunia kroppenstedtii TaxID=1121721 RepID=UPI000368811A|nr:MinD/ParA family protein [Jongsikchunia kroppenstedtii]
MSSFNDRTPSPPWHAAGDQSSAHSSALRPATPYQPAAPTIPPRVRGWRRALRSASGGLITFGGNTSAEAVRELVNRVRQPVREDFRVAVLSLKGGVGKTTVTIGLGSALASLRQDRVIAVDANPDLGTLARRVPSQTTSTVRTLLQDENVNWYTDIRRHTSQALSGLEVLASESDPAISEAFNEDEYLQVVETLGSHYPLILTDCGTGLVHSAMTGVLKSVSNLVLVTSPAIDGAQSAVATLDWLQAHGMGKLAADSIVVIASTKTKNPPVDVAMLTNYFQSRVRAVQVIPYDEHLAVGGLIDLDQLNRKTRSAFLELAAAVVDRFAVPTQPMAWPQPQPQQAQPQQAPAPNPPPQHSDPQHVGPQHAQPQPQWPAQQPAYPGHLQTPYERWPIPPVQSEPTYPHTGMHPDSPMGPGLPYGPR